MDLAERAKRFEAELDELSLRWGVGMIAVAGLSPDGRIVTEIQYIERLVSVMPPAIGKPEKD